MMNSLYLVRHGENHANLTLEFSHHKVDYSLTPKGVLQARQTAEYFRDKPIDAVYSSPLKRALETAQLIAEPHQLPVISVEAFREINVGELEGQLPTAELWAQHDAVLAAWTNGHPETRFPRGENYHELLARAAAGLEAVLSGQDERSFVIVGHGGIFTTALYGLCVEDDQALIKGMPNCSITTLEAEMQNGALKVHIRSYASTEHLSGDAARMVSGLPKSNQ